MPCSNRCLHHLALPVLLLSVLLFSQTGLAVQQAGTESKDAEFSQLQKVLPHRQASRLLEQLDRFRAAIRSGDQDQVLLCMAEGFKAFGQNSTVSKNIVLPQFLQQFSANSPPPLRLLSVSGSPKDLVLIIGSPADTDFKLRLNFDSDFKIVSFEQEKTDPKSDETKAEMLEKQSSGMVGGLVKVAHTGPTAWKIQYQLSGPVRSIFFGPKTEAYHAKSWRLPDDFHFSVEGPYSFLERKDGGEFRQVAINVETYPHVVMYAPQPFMVFGSGTAINTYSLGLAARVGPEKQMGGFRPEFQFLGFRDEVVLIPGYEPNHADPIAYPQQGLFVFFGNRDGLIETAEVRTVLDNDFPTEWIGLYLRASNGFANLYNDQLGRANPGKLNMLVSFESDPRMGRSGFSGGAQGDAIAAKVYRPTDKDPSHEQTVDRLRLFFAHEMGHIWQQNLGQDDARWFNEGEADLLAITACSQLGYLTPAQIAANLTKRVSPCLQAMAKTSLMESHMNGFPQANYEGGGLALAAAVAATGADGVQDNVFDLDVELKTFPAEELANKPLPTFFAALRKRGATQAACDSIDEFITRKHEAPQQALIKMLDATGLDYSTENDQITIESTFAEGMFPVGSEGPAQK